MTGADHGQLHYRLDTRDGGLVLGDCRVILLIVEVLIPGVFLFWLGLAAIAVAIQSAWIPVPWQAQIAFFILYSGLLVWISRRIDAGRKTETDQPNLNQRAGAMIGREATLGADIVDGIGAIKLDDTQWRVAGPDLTAGTRIRITSVDGNTLRIMKPKSAEDASDEVPDATP